MEMTVCVCSHTYTQVEQCLRAARIVKGHVMSEKKFITASKFTKIYLCLIARIWISKLFFFYSSISPSIWFCKGKKANYLFIWEKKRNRVIQENFYITIHFRVNNGNSSDRVSTTDRLLYVSFNESREEKAWRKLPKNAAYHFEWTLEAALYKITVVWPLTSHLTSHPSKTSWALLKKLSRTHKRRYTGNPNS